MKPSKNPQFGGPPAAKRPDLLTKVHQQALAAQQQMAKRRKDRITMWRAVLIGGFAVVAVFACLEGLQPGPKQPEIAAARLLREQAAPAATPTRATKSSAPTPDQPADSTPQAPADPAAPNNTPGITEAAAADPTAAERLAAEPEILLTGLDSQRDAAINRNKELLKRAIEGQAWDAYRTLLGKSVKAGLTSIAQGQGVNRFDPLWKEAPLYQALLRWKTLGCFSESEISALVTDSYSGQFLIWLLGNNAAMEELLLTIHPDGRCRKSPQVPHGFLVAPSGQLPEILPARARLRRGFR